MYPPVALTPEPATETPDSSLQERWYGCRGQSCVQVPSRFLRRHLQDRSPSSHLFPVTRLCSELSIRLQNLDAKTLRTDVVLNYYADGIVSTSQDPNTNRQILIVLAYARR